MAEKLDLVKIQALAASGAYGGQRLYSALSEVLTLSCSVFYGDLENWQGASDELTDAEIDDIAEINAVLQYEAMTNMSNGGYELVERVVRTTATSTIGMSGLTGDYVYHIECQLINGGSGQANISVNINGRAQSEYTRQTITAIAAAVTGFRTANSSLIATIPNGQQTYLRGSLCLVNSYLLGLFNSAVFGAVDTVSSRQVSVQQQSTETHIENIALSSSIADGFGVGTIVSLYKSNY